MLRGGNVELECVLESPNELCPAVRLGGELERGENARNVTMTHISDLMQPLLNERGLFGQVIQ